jgi:hypothetical protein
MLPENTRRDMASEEARLEKHFSLNATPTSGWETG